MLQHQQYITDISPNNRPSQQSSPSDQSVSTATPPHQISRASPASTALVMSSNNINGTSQPASRQLTPNTSSSNNGTGSSNGNTGQHGGPPNPMVRQFACHTKSMSAGVVVSVPGISNNLATATGMNNMTNHNNVPNHAHNNGKQSGFNNNHQVNTNHHQHALKKGHQQQQVIREHRNHHRPQLSQPAHPTHHHQTMQLPIQQQSHQPYPGGNHHSNGQNGSSSNFINARQTNSSSIILSNNNINNIHARSASTHLSSMMLNGSQNQHTQSNHLITNPRHYPPNVTNSIWSIDENISKSQGKLTNSSYIHYPFNPSMTDMSCDNLSNCSRLVDGLAAPGYYLHASSNLPNSNALSSCTIKIPEFLPICDLMFNLISMIMYFCDNTFGIIAVIALYYHTSSKHWSLIGAAFIIGSNIICQYLSFKWLYKIKLEDCRRKKEAQEELEDEEGCERRYYNRMAANMRNYQCGSCTWLPNGASGVQLKFLLSVALDAITHILCLGFLIRYIKMVIPVKDTTRVKRQARDLCMLRMTHGFAQSAPILLLQAFVVCSQASSSSLANLSVTSAVLSLFNVCWALASFTKYARRKYMHKFDPTWLGIISQFLWRLCTVSSRVAALTIYAVYYNYWMLGVILLHWITMFFWLIKPGNLLRDEPNLSRTKKVSYAMAAAWIYCFCYMNFEEHNSKLKMTSYYLVMFLENNLLLTVCLIFSSQVTWFKNLSILIVYLGFVLGLIFIVLYYKYFHVNVLDNGLSCSQASIDSIADQLSPAGKMITGFKPGTLRLKGEDSITSAHRFNTNVNGTLHTGSHPEITRNNKPAYFANQAPVTQSNVFNYKLDQGFKKQKIPNSHVRHHNS